MPRRERPPVTRRSEHWMRKAVNEHGDALNSLVGKVFGWDQHDRIDWLSLGRHLSIPFCSTSSRGTLLASPIDEDYRSDVFSAFEGPA
jgi:hypothetical protein